MNLRSWLLMLGCPVALSIVACSTHETDDTANSESNASVVDCTSARAYVSGADYSGEDIVTNANKTYQCKSGPASGWCDIGGPYEPGVGWAWSYAWDEVTCLSNGSGGGAGTGAGGSSAGTAGSVGKGGTGGTGGSGESGGSGGTAGKGGSGGSGGSAGKGGASGSGGTGGSTPKGCDTPGLVWKTGAKTYYESYPDPGSEECIKFSGCEYMGMFSACSGVKSEAWVKSHNIVAVFPDFNKLKLHDLCLKKGNKTIVATVYDQCADSDCDGCCSANRGNKDQLIDVEKYTQERWGVFEDGEVQWADLGPTKGTGCQ